MPQSVHLGDLRNGIHVEIASHEQSALLVGNRVQPVIDRRLQRIPVDSLLNIVGGSRQALAQFIQRVGQTVRGPLERVPGPIAGDREVARDLSQKGAQAGGAGRRNTVPGPQPGIIQTFLHILLDTEDIVGDLPAVPAILIYSLFDRGFIPLPEQINDLFIIHKASIHDCTQRLPQVFIPKRIGRSEASHYKRRKQELSGYCFSVVT